MFISRFNGGIIGNFDYSSLEIRVLGLASKDETMTKAFFEDADAHKETASIIYDKEISEVTKDERQSAKGFSFGQ